MILIPANLTVLHVIKVNCRVSSLYQAPHAPELVGNQGKYIAFLDQLLHCLLGLHVSSMLKLNTQKGTCVCLACSSRVTWQAGADRGKSD